SPADAKPSRVVWEWPGSPGGDASGVTTHVLAVPQSATMVTVGGKLLFVADPSISSEDVEPLLSGRSIDTVSFSEHSLDKLDDFVIDGEIHFPDATNRVV